MWCVLECELCVQTVWFDLWDSVLCVMLAEALIYSIVKPLDVKYKQDLIYVGKCLQDSVFDCGLYPFLMFCWQMNGAERVIYQDWAFFLNALIKEFDSDENMTGGLRPVMTRVKWCLSVQGKVCVDVEACVCIIKVII